MKRETAVKINGKLGEIVVSLKNRMLLSPLTESEGRMYRDIHECVAEIREILVNSTKEKENGT